MRPPVLPKEPKRTYSVHPHNGGKVSNVVDALVVSDLVASRAEARRLIAAGGFYLNDVRVTDPACEISADDLLTNSSIALRKGKREYSMLVFNGVVR